MAETLLMGVLNLTPDSFSDGGDHEDLDGALAHAQHLIAAGADIIDVGGESTRPGAVPVAPEEEQRRVLPVLEKLLDLDARLSLDTRHPGTARAALQLAGERAEGMIINDVSGLLTDPDMPVVVAEYGCEVVITHNRGDSTTMQQLTDYDDVAVAVVDELTQIRQPYLDAGVDFEKIILDPGIGFAKTHQQNWELIGQLERILLLGHRVLFGVSRKGFLGGLLADEQGPRPAAQRDSATAALSFHAARSGCWAVRVHSVRPNRDALRAAAAVG
ncbi:dihydropteroate synthase [Garicola koreensis]|uniref:dihydropteroate synthase n=1 Tax=Garicola koreensis TaxID=1262554 RepID=UPI0031EAC8B9